MCLREGLSHLFTSFSGSLSAAWPWWTPWDNSSGGSEWGRRQNAYLCHHFPGASRDEAGGYDARGAVDRPMVCGDIHNPSMKIPHFYLFFLLSVAFGMRETPRSIKVRISSHLHWWHGEAHNNMINEGYMKGFHLLRLLPITMAQFHAAQLPHLSSSLLRPALFNLLWVTR